MNVSGFENRTELKKQQREFKIAKDIMTGRKNAASK